MSQITLRPKSKLIIHVFQREPQILHGYYVITERNKELYSNTCIF